MGKLWQSMHAPMPELVFLKKLLVQPELRKGKTQRRVNSQNKARKERTSIHPYCGSLGLQCLTNVQPRSCKWLLPPHMDSLVYTNLFSRRLCASGRDCIEKLGSMNQAMTCRLLHLEIKCWPLGTNSANYSTLTDLYIGLLVNKSLQWSIQPVSSLSLIHMFNKSCQQLAFKLLLQ